jgi:hypothetical protein
MYKTFVSNCRRFLLRYNKLIDVAKVAPDGDPLPVMDTADREYFRNNPGASYIDKQYPQGPFRLYRPKPLAGPAIANHLVSGGTSTLWAINEYPSPAMREAHGGRVIFLMLLDIDDKQRTGQAARVAQLAAEICFGGNAYIEPSRSGWGRHVYFLLDATFIKLVHLRDVLESLANELRYHADLQTPGVVVDRFFGLPTIWHRTKQMSVEELPPMRISSRGNLLKIPYLPEDEQDLERLAVLKPVPFAELEDLFLRLDGWGTRGTKGERTNSLGKTISCDEANAFVKKLRCVDQMLRITMGECTVDQVLQHYHEHYHPTGMSDRDIRVRLRKLSRILERRHRTFDAAKLGNPWSFRPGKYLERVRTVVTADAFAWKSRQVINHERLADFVGYMVQQAFHKPPTDPWFARTTRNVMLANMKKLRELKLVNWTCSPNQYSKLLAIAREHRLLEVHEDYCPPTRDKAGRRVTVQVGKGFGESWGAPRQIGPGPELLAEYAAFAPLLAQWQATHRQQNRRVA